MTEKLNRFNITVSPVMKDKLDKVKEELYSKETDENMIRDLITLGLEAVEEKKITVQSK